MTPKLTEAQTEAMKAEEARAFAEYEAWLAHPFTHALLAHAHRRATTIADEALGPALDDHGALEARLRYQIMEEIALGTFARDAYLDGLHAIRRPYYAHAATADLKAQALAGEAGSSSGSRRPGLFSGLWHPGAGNK